MTLTRKELLTSKEYWTVQIQNDLYAAIDQYMKENGLTRTSLAEKLNVTKGYITQVLNGDFDHKVSKLVELALACGVAPLFHFVKMEEFIKNDAQDKVYDVLPMTRNTRMVYKADLPISMDSGSKKNWIRNIHFQENLAPDADKIGHYEFNQA